jgi:MFS family permease
VQSEDLQKLYDWRQSQALSLASACFTLAGLVLSPLLAAVFDKASLIQPWQLALYVSGAVLAAVSGVWWHHRARRQQSEFVRRLEEPETLTW